MCDSRTCTYPCGEDEFRGYVATWGPDAVKYPHSAPVGTTRYGVMVSQPAHQWEIVAVQADRPRHVAFISTVYCLDWVLDMASRIAGSR